MLVDQLEILLSLNIHAQFLNFLLILFSKIVSTACRDTLAKLFRDNLHFHVWHSVSFMAYKLNFMHKNSSVDRLPKIKVSKPLSEQNVLSNFFQCIYTNLFWPVISFLMCRTLTFYYTPINDATLELSVFWPSDTKSLINELKFSESISFSF